MSFDFNALNLEVLDISTNMSPDIYVNLRGVTFSKKILEELGYPAYVQFVTDPKNKVFGIRCSRQDGHRAAPFSKPRKEQKATVSFNNKNIWEPIRKMMEDEWKSDRRYRVTGHLLDDKKTMIFILTEGVMDDFRLPKEENE